MFPDTQKLKKRATATITPIHPEHRNSVSSVLTSVAEVADDRTNAGTLGASSLTLRQSVLPVSLVITLFCVWGFASGMLEILNKHFQHTLHVSKAQSAGLQVAFFGAYLIGPLTYSGWIVRRFGYRIAFVIGLCIYGLSALLFYPSGAKRSFGAFCAAVFIMGSGLSSLETAGMPYIAVCGPPRWSELRVNLSCALQSSSSVTAIVIASFIILDGKNPHEADSLKSVQFVYLGIGCFALMLACAFFFAPIPEITDADMASQAAASALVTGWTEKPLRKQYLLFLGVASCFCYSGGQIALTTFFINYATEVDKSLSSKTAAHRLAVAQASFAAARFLCAFAMRWLNPRHMLLTASLVTTGVLSSTIGARGKAGVALLTLEFVSKACVSPTTFTLSLRGLGRHTKRGASFLIAAVCGGTIFAPLLGAVADKKGMNIAMAVPVAGLALSLAFPIYANFWKAKELDGFRLGVREANDVEKANNDHEKNNR